MIWFHLSFISFVLNAFWLVVDFCSGIFQGVGGVVSMLYLGNFMVLSRTMIMIMTF
jgi:hypothetical protein